METQEQRNQREMREKVTLLINSVYSPTVLDEANAGAMHAQNLQSNYHLYHPVLAKIIDGRKVKPEHISDLEELRRAI